MRTIKCTLVGDPLIGKGSLLRTYVNGTFEEESEPIIFDNFLVTQVVDKKECQLTLWYANGMEEYDRLRPLSYPGTHVILLCFSIDDLASFYNTKDKWLVEMTHYCPGTPILLVGLKVDLRVKASNEGQIEIRVQSSSEDDLTLTKTKYNDDLITFEEGEAMAAEIGAVKYMEVSSMKQYGMQELFDETVRTAVLLGEFQNQEKCKGCLIS